MTFFKYFSAVAVAVKDVRGFGADRSRSEEVVQAAVKELRGAIAREGYAVKGNGDGFTIASYADGYELWLRVEATADALLVRSDR
jgi:hypothetical protein